MPRLMPSQKHTKIEISLEAYLALESESILQDKTLKKLASEFILKGVSKESLDFAQKAMPATETNKIDEEKTAKVIKDIGTPAIKLDENLLGTIQRKLPNEGYLATMLFVAQNTASLERDELHRVLTIFAYYNIPLVLAASILGKLNNASILTKDMHY